MKTQVGLIEHTITVAPTSSAIDPIELLRLIYANPTANSHRAQEILARTSEVVYSGGSAKSIAEGFRKKGLEGRNESSNQACVGNEMCALAS